MISLFFTILASCSSSLETLADRMTAERLKRRLTNLNYNSSCCDGGTYEFTVLANRVPNKTKSANLNKFDSFCRSIGLEDFITNDMSPSIKPTSYNNHDSYYPSTVPEGFITYSSKISHVVPKPNFTNLRINTSILAETPRPQKHAESGAEAYSDLKNLILAVSKYPYPIQVEIDASVAVNPTSETTNERHPLVRIHVGSKKTSHGNDSIKEFTIKVPDSINMETLASKIIEIVSDCDCSAK